VPQVLIQPVFGNREASANWANTVQHQVRFDATDNAAVLTDAQLRTLLAIHPSGQAQIWGVTANQNSRADRIQPGDVILFTGHNFVLAIGRVGCSFRNSAFADLLWKPHPERGSWLNIYSILALEPAGLPYDVLRGLPHFPSGHRFMGFEILKPNAAEDVLDYLGIEAAPESPAERELEAQVIAESLEGLGEPADSGRFLDIEGAHTAEGEYERAASKVRFRRVEARLVHTYTETLDGFIIKRYKTTSQLMTDIYLTKDDGTRSEIIEAKGKADHAYVREALGQLLDYAPHLEPPAERLSALFPARPSEADVALLHRYGIDLIYHDGAGRFAREAAPAAHRDSMRQIWSRMP
jgi:hypothetical protein